MKLLSMFHQTNRNWQTIHWKPVMSKWLVSYATGTQQKSVSCLPTIHPSLIVLWWWLLIHSGHRKTDGY
jgi:hypothetical protein